ncbi:hypothetical protein B7494_g6507 [Chlorociboria aeruginascens]|nr:hypothetical protein B7494_g6507 [Chlorociboria aeruginascens]
MATQDIIAPLAAPLPDGPPQDFFNETQWASLMAIMDTVIPSIRRESTTTDKISQLTISDTQYNTTVDHIKNAVVNPPDSVLLDEYLNERPSDNPRFQALLKRTMMFYARDDAKKGLSLVLSALNNRVGSYLLTGYATPIQEQPIRVREAILERWRTSYLATLQVLHKQMTSIGKNLWAKTSNQLEKVTGFPAVPNDYKPPSNPYEYEFLQFQAGSEPQVIETDVVIVGSGCGGAVCAKNLAEAGHRVVVVDKSYYFPPSQLPMTQEQGSIHLYENGGATVTDDSSVTVVAGSNWGGGGTVNWSASLQPQEYVRKEWAEDRNLPFFGTAEFQACLDRVCRRMGVSTDHIRQNHGNNVILDGSRKLGYAAKAVPQNTGGQEHYCGHCVLGCGSAGKQGPVVSWLPDAGKSGAEFIEGFKVDRVLFDESSGTKIAIGVKGTWTSRNSRGSVDGPISEKIVREVIVKAKKVVVSCGTLWSPIILMNSGLKNQQIGRNLYLHPVNFVCAIFKEDVRPWEVCTSFENLDNHGHGTKLEVTSALPSYLLTFLNCKNGLAFKAMALKYRHMNLFISIARDRDTGRIYPDPILGVPRIAYTPSEFDRNNIMEGMIALAKICYIEGATEIHPAVQGIDPFIREPVATEDGHDLGVEDPRFKAWLAEVRHVGNKPPTGTFAAAHQMGTNRMSARPQDGVVDPKGKVWGTEGLYISDASVFPSASGVNPMITNMAISDWISRGITKELRSAAVEARL